MVRGVEFDAFVDHSALVQILTSKDEPCTDRVRKMLFKLSDYVFNVKYMKGSNLVLADCLSRAPRSNDAEFDVVQPVSFSVSVQTDEENAHDKELVMPIQPYTRPVTRAYAKEQGLEVPDLYPQKVSRDNLDISTDSLDVSDDLSETVEISEVVEEPQDPPSDLDTQLAPGELSCENNTTEEAVDNSQDPAANLDSKPTVSANINGSSRDSTRGVRLQPGFNRSNWSGNLKRAAPPERLEPLLMDKLREQVIGGSIEIPEELYQWSEPIVKQIDSIETKGIQKQAEMNKLMEVIKRKIIKNFNLPINCNVLRVEQETSPFFKPVYDFLAHDILPSDAKAAKTINHRAEEYILCNGLLFRLVYKNKEQDFTLQLAIPENMVDKIIAQFHDTILSSHQGVTRTYLTIRRSFYIPRMFERISGYIKSCLRCQEFRGKPDNLRRFHCRIPQEYRPFDSLSIDFNTMPASYTGVKHILVMCDEITRFVICVPLRTLTAETICEAIIQKVVGIFGPPSRIISDAAASFTGKLVTLLCDALQIDRKVVSIENHGSLQVERHIQTIGNFLKKHLNQFGKDWM